MAGAKIQTIENKMLPSRLNEVHWETSHLKPVTYIITLEHTGAIETTIVNIK